MDIASDTGIAFKFAKKLVAQMLFRRGTRFDDAAHRILVKDGENSIVLSVKYVSDIAEERVHQQWLEAKTGQGYDVFTDEATAA